MKSRKTGGTVQQHAAPRDFAQDALGDMTQNSQERTGKCRGAAGARARGGGVGGGGQRRAGVSGARSR